MDLQRSSILEIGLGNQEPESLIYLEKYHS